MYYLEVNMCIIVHSSIQNLYISHWIHWLCTALTKDQSREMKMVYVSKINRCVTIWWKQRNKKKLECWEKNQTNWINWILHIIQETAIHISLAIYPVLNVLVLPFLRIEWQPHLKCYLLRYFLLKQIHLVINCSSCCYSFSRTCLIYNSLNSFQFLLTPFLKWNYRWVVVMHLLCKVFMVLQIWLRFLNSIIRKQKYHLLQAYI